MSVVTAIYRYLFRPGKARFTRKDRWLAQYAIGEWTYGLPKVFDWGEGATLKIGRFCSISDDVTIMLGGEHRVDWVTTYPFNKVFSKAAGFTGHPRSRGDVIIGNDVWIAQGSLILSGVTIGDGAVIGADSVVTKNVPPYAIVAGNPAHLIRYRFDEATIAALQRIAWWNWPLTQIEEAWPLLLSPDIGSFIARYQRESAIEREETI